MTGYMFRSKIGALVFLGLILFSAYRMVGTEGDAGELVAAVETIEANQQGETSFSQAPEQPSTELTFEQWAAEPVDEAEPTGKPTR